MIFAVACEAVEESGRPVARWPQREIIVDQVNTHWSVSLVLWVQVMENLTLPEDELGVKGKVGDPEEAGDS